MTKYWMSGWINDLILNARMNKWLNIKCKDE